MLGVKHGPESRAPNTQFSGAQDADSCILEGGRVSDLPVGEMALTPSLSELVSLCVHCLNVTRCSLGAALAL